MRQPVTGICLASSLALLASLTAADATTITTTFNVTANVTVQCAIAGTALSFGTYDRGSATPLDAQTNILVNCTNGSTWELALDKGLHGASVTTRQMANTSDTTVVLNYALFSDPAHTNNWGETTGTDTVTGTGTGTTQSIGVYGRLPARQNTATAGGYSDTITATLTF